MNPEIESEIFIETSRHFCAWIEAPAMNLKHGLKTSVLLISKLYQEGLVLPHTDKDNLIAPINVTDELLESLSERFKGFPFTHFHLAKLNTNQTDSNSQADLNSQINTDKHNLAESFAIIYQNIKNGLNLLDNDNPNDAIHYWRVGFKLQWGKTATYLLLVMHEHLANEKLL